MPTLRILAHALLTAHAAAQTLTLQVAPPQGSPDTFIVETASTNALSPSRPNFLSIGLMIE